MVEYLDYPLYARGQPETEHAILYTYPSLSSHVVPSAHSPPDRASAHRKTRVHGSAGKGVSPFPVTQSKSLLQPTA
jgi:hypothetical protein